jgi:hypothetical protein
MKVDAARLEARATKPISGTIKLSVPPDDLFSMTRTPSFAAWTLLACATAFAASRAETTTYVDGNLTGISANTGGTLLFSDDKALVFRTGLATVNVPYASITRSELGATRETSHGAPIYKIWARHKKTETQFLVVEFKNEEGEAKSMTLELAQGSAPSVLATIKDHNGATTEVAETSAAAPVKAVRTAPAAVAKNTTDAGSKASPATKAGSEWWGDNIWKTTNNASTWTKPAGASAPEE